MPPKLPETAVPTLPAAPPTAETVSGFESASVSFARALPVVAAFSFVVALSFAATGRSLTAPTLPVTVAVAVAPNGSATV